MNSSIAPVYVKMFYNRARLNSMAPYGKITHIQYGLYDKQFEYEENIQLSNVLSAAMNVSDGMMLSLLEIEYMMKRTKWVYLPGQF